MSLKPLRRSQRKKLSLSDVDEGPEAGPIDGLLFAFQTQGHSSEFSGVLRTVPVVVEKVVIRTKQYLYSNESLESWG